MSKQIDRNLEEDLEVTLSFCFFADGFPARYAGFHPGLYEALRLHIVDGAPLYLARSKAMPRMRLHTLALLLGDAAMRLKWTDLYLFCRGFTGWVPSHVAMKWEERRALFPIDADSDQSATHPVHPDIKALWSELDRKNPRLGDAKFKKPTARYVIR